MKSDGKNLVIPFFIQHAGCPFTCVFCNQWQITGQKDIDRPEQVAARVSDYLQTVKGKPDSVEIAFYGGSFTGLPFGEQEKWLKEACEIKKKGLVSGIRLSTRPDFITEDTLENLQRYGVTTVELGVQSLVDEVLIQSCRGYLSETVYKATRLIRGYPFQLVYQLMLGLPGDTMARARLSAERTVKAAPEAVRIYPALVLKGSTLARWHEEGSYVPWSLEQAVEAGAEWLALFSLYEIKVIRMGLLASKNLDQKHSLAAGPYHPAYGELVEGRLMLKQLKSILNVLGNDFASLTVSFNPRDYSKVAGHKKIGIQEIKKEYGIDHIELQPDDNVAENDLKVTVGSETIHLTRQEFLEKYRINEGNLQKGKDGNRCT